MSRSSSLTAHEGVCPASAELVDTANCNEERR